MKFFHTADWHLGKLVQGVYMTEDQRYVLEQFVSAVEQERPDAVIIAGDLYDRAIPPTEAVDLLDELLERIVVGLDTPVLAISGNHDSPDRIDFGTAMMESRGLHIAGRLRTEHKPVVLKDACGEVHVHLIPYADPAQVRVAFEDESIRTHDEAMRAITERIASQMDPEARHIVVGHAFVTATGEAEPNTSDSERPLSIGGAEHVRAAYFEPFHYTALGHLHQAHFVGSDKIRYAGSPLKYSISEENHKKGYLVVELDANGQVSIEKRELQPLRDMRRIAGPIEEIETHPVNEDYVFVTLLNDNPVLFPMEKVRAVYPNALHVERRVTAVRGLGEDGDAPEETMRRSEADPVSLFESFYMEVKGIPLDEPKKKLFADAFGGLLREEGEAK
ncbi:exonuclease SbcCD subunit D [Paenibacillus glycanilyticus]|uniref:Nuclease SbcCD subunit D n=1 Tax=Paenibacillus glycanilyticus TaxID=126569 RepID=A0ABQ6G414_9BACL|nr:exonuclease SbcCD subunit D [Paenibacillus glycanilyticus]GLX65699.1 nuclease SbcCD subunit D [Paenibacillus glycanilyticus]